MGFKYFLKHTIVPKIKSFNKFIKKSKKYFGLQCRVKSKKILMTGGYGYSNVGDEAQCNATALWLKENFPDYEIIMLTPNPELSYNKHGFPTQYASRVAFWNHYCNGNVYDFDNSLLKKFIFIFRGFWILFNAYLVKYELPPIFINARAIRLLQEIKESSLFYYSGGGFLTGKTLSRLWDGIFVCRICNTLDTPVVMSGQTIGVWGNWFNKIFASWGFKNVKIIASRDKKYTINDLFDIDTNAILYETHDDALFCQKSDKKYYNGDYITLNYHYWQMDENNIKKLEHYLDELVKIIPYKIILLSMTPPNEKVYESILTKHPDKCELFEYDYDFKKLRQVIADSKLCITMKHHPIIFAYGEDVPVISIIHTDYYFHKNIGAMAQYNQERFALALDDKNFIEKFKTLLEEILNSKKSIEEIKSAKQIHKSNKERFLNDVKKILKV